MLQALLEPGRDGGCRGGSRCHNSLASMASSICLGRRRGPKQARGAHAPGWQQAGQSISGLGTRRVVPKWMPRGTRVLGWPCLSCAWQKVPANSHAAASGLL